jgi:hypothetical protein
VGLVRLTAFLRAIPERISTGGYGRMPLPDTHRLDPIKKYKQKILMNIVCYGVKRKSIP